MNQPTENDMLAEMFRLQDELQVVLTGKRPGMIPTTLQRIDFIKDMHIALTDELHEALAETGWKPWASSKHINVREFKGELVDAFHFFMNLCLVVNMSPEELFEMYKVKHQRNIDRSTEGYDGIDGKCVGCKRSFDDLAKARDIPVEAVTYQDKRGSVCYNCYFEGSSK